MCTRIRPAQQVWIMSVRWAWWKASPWSTYYFKGT